MFINFTDDAFGIDFIFKGVRRFLRLFSKSNKKRPLVVGLDDGIDWDVITELAAENLKDAIDKDILGRVYEQADEAAVFWCEMQEKEVAMRMKAGHVPKIFVMPPAVESNVIDGVPTTTVKLRSQIDNAHLTCDVHFKEK